MPSFKRGYCLTPTGLKKIETARWGSFPKLSWEKISFLGCLDRTTVSKAINGIAVDLRSIKKLFMAVSIKLSDEDYCLRQSYQKLSLVLANKTMTMTDNELLIKAAEDLEKAAENESGTERKQELLDRGKDLRIRAAELAD
jgi:hypothetical protein